MLQLLELLKFFNPWAKLVKQIRGLEFRCLFSIKLGTLSIDLCLEVLNLDLVLVLLVRKLAMLVVVAFDFRFQASLLLLHLTKHCKEPSWRVPNRRRSSAHSSTGEPFDSSSRSWNSSRASPFLNKRKPVFGLLAFPEKLVLFLVLRRRESL
jgi:hypothetical protein